MKKAIPFRLRIGVTGHRQLPDDPALLKREIKTLEDQFGGEFCFSAGVACSPTDPGEPARWPNRGGRAPALVIWALTGALNHRPAAILTSGHLDKPCPELNLRPMD